MIATKKYVSCICSVATRRGGGDRQDRHHKNSVVDSDNATLEAVASYLINQIRADRPIIVQVSPRLDPQLKHLVTPHNEAIVIKDCRLKDLFIGKDSPCQRYRVTDPFTRGRVLDLV